VVETAPAPPPVRAARAYALPWLLLVATLAVLAWHVF
jgi:hypothetical protein